MAPAEKKPEKDPMKEIVCMLEEYEAGTPKRSETGSKVNIDDWGE